MPDTALQNAENICRERGVRLTPQRKRVLEIVARSPRPLGAYDIMAAMDEDGDRKTAPPTVYRALDFLLEQGLVHKIASLHAFVSCHHPEHDHASQFLICKDCGRVDELENQSIDQGVQDAAAAVGFVAQQQTVEVLGRCMQCQN